jgi:hypothetical protein
MGSTREKGKIPHSEWPKILARYNSGETIASIGRVYGCTAPAIRYIVKRSGPLKDQPSRRPISDVSKAPRREGSLAAETGQLPSMGRAKLTRGPQILSEELRKRVSSDVALFLVALDQAVVDGSVASISSLQEATDRLMRSTARTRLELERMLSGYGSAGVQRDSREEILPA